MFVLGLFALCLTGFCIGFALPRPSAVAAVAVLLVGWIVMRTATGGHIEDQALVTVVWLVCVVLISGACALGVIMRAALRRDPRDDSTRRSRPN